VAYVVGEVLYLANKVINHHREDKDKWKRRSNNFSV